MAAAPHYTHLLYALLDSQEIESYHDAITSLPFLHQVVQAITSPISLQVPLALRTAVASRLLARIEAPLPLSSCCVKQK